MFEIRREIVNLLLSWSRASGKSILVPYGEVFLYIYSGNGEITATRSGRQGFRLLPGDYSCKLIEVKRALEKTGHVLIVVGWDTTPITLEKLIGILAVWGQGLREKTAAPLIP